MDMLEQFVTDFLEKHIWRERMHAQHTEPRATWQQRVDCPEKIVEGPTHKHDSREQKLVAHASIQKETEVPAEHDASSPGWMDMYRDYNDDLLQQHQRLQIQEMMQVLGPLHQAGFLHLDELRRRVNESIGIHRTNEQDKNLDETNGRDEKVDSDPDSTVEGRRVSNTQHGD